LPKGDGGSLIALSRFVTQLARNDRGKPRSQYFWFARNPPAIASTPVLQRLYQSWLA
jgi:hypothetical protein